MPKLIVVGGSPATGKTSLAKKLAEETGFVRVSMDEIKEVLFDVVGYRDRAWSQEVGKAAWPVFQKFVHLHLDRGDSVIAEAIFLYPEDKDWLQDLAKAHGAELIQIWMTANPLVARERFIQRAGTTRHPGHNDSLETVLGEFDERFFNRSFIPHPINGKTFEVDTTESFPDISKIIQRIME